MHFDVILAADLDWGIGKTNALPWPRLRGDLAHFKAVTTTASNGRRNAIAMGRRTWESKELAGKPLPRRLNIVISRQEIATPDGVICAHGIDDAITKQGDAETLFVIGGAEIFQLAIAHPALRYVYLTRVQGRFGCDVRIPTLDAGFEADPGWPASEHLDNDVNDVPYQIQRLTRRKRN